MFKQIVVGYDGSDRALKAVEQAADLASGMNAKLHLVKAVPTNQTHKVGVGSDEVVLSDIDIAEGQLKNLASKFTGVDTTYAARSGSPAKVLIAEAGDDSTAMIVVGNRNVQGMSRALNSVAEAVAHKAPCAVLIAQTA